MTNTLAYSSPTAFNIATLSIKRLRVTTPSINTLSITILIIAVNKYETQPTGTS
jgi:hypothetical protein